MVKVRINYASWDPYTVIKIDGNETSLGGVAAELYEAMKQTMDFDYETNLQPDLQFGIKSPNGEWNGMIGSAVNDEADIVGPFFMNEDRGTAVSFSNPLANAQLSITTGLASSVEGSFLIFEVVSYQIWILLAITIFVATWVASLIYFAKSKPSTKTKQEVLNTYVWIFYGAALGRDYGNTEIWYLRNVWKCFSFRVLQGTYSIFISLILINTYKGVIMSALATEKLEPRYASLEDLMEDRDVPVTTSEATYTVFCFKNNLKYRSIWNRMAVNLLPPIGDISNVPEFLNTVEKGKSVFILETTYMRSIVGERFRQTGKCQLRTIPFSLCSGYMSFGFNRRFSTTTREKFQEKLLRFLEGGLSERVLNTATSYYDICTQARVSSVRALNLTQLAGVFVIFAFGIITSIVVFIVEMMLSVKCVSPVIV